MNTLEFLRRVLPSAGLYVVARLVKDKWRHQVCDSLEETAAYALQFDSQGVPTYHACAAYRERSVEGHKGGQTYQQIRVQRNVRALRAFWMDLDVKPGINTAFESQGAALEALVDFCEVTKLPMPVIVSSGGGIHIYWTLTDEVLPENWKPIAEGLKKLAAHHNFKADPACTADPARVLRTLGTHNRKVPGVVRSVELVADADPIAAKDFVNTVTAALSRIGEKPEEAVKVRETKVEQLNQAFTIQQNFPPCSGEKVATRCAQLARFKNTRGNIPEPFWYAGIQLLTHSIEGDELIHEWSKGYDGYSHGETAGKIEQVRSQSIGPTLCKTFESVNPGGCDGCAFKGKISSPVQLGTYIASAPPPIVLERVEGREVQVELPPVPAPFTRGVNGGIYTEEEGITLRIYEYDCFPVEIAYDERRGFETMRVRHHLPKEGWLEFTCQSALLAKPSDFEVELRNNHVQPLIRNRMAMYFDSYLRTIREKNKMKRLFKSMGWKNEDTEFVLGDKLYRKDGVLQTGYSQGSDEFLGNFRAKGSLDEWRELTTIFQNPDLAPHAFMLLIAFAAPLLKLANKQGFTVSAYGDTGTGKSTMGKLLASVYGHPERTWAPYDATANARSERLGMYNALPAYMDEVSTMDSKDVREMIYSIATGKGRDSLTRTRETRKGLDWTTILVCSTNDAMQTKLQMEKANAEAESMRLFEFRFPMVSAFAEPSRRIPRILLENYGLAGARYIENLVAHRDAIAPQLWEVVESIGEEFGMASQERFWTQAIAYTLFGGALAREWEIIDFDPDVIRPWIRKETMRMRGELKDAIVTPLAILGQYLNEHVGERLVVTKLNAGFATNYKPMMKISQRWEKDGHRLYIARGHMKVYLERRGFDYGVVRDDLQHRGVLVGTDARKVLGANTEIGGSQISCWRIRTDHVDLGLDAPDAP